MNFFICNRYDKRNEDIYIITPNFPIDKDKIYIYKYNQFKKLNPEKTYVFSKNESKNNKTFQSFEETDELQIIDYPYQNQNRENNINSIFFDKAKMTTSFMENNSGYYYCFKNSNINDNSFNQNEIKKELNKKDKLISLVSNSNGDKTINEKLFYDVSNLNEEDTIKGEDNINLTRLKMENNNINIKKHISKIKNIPNNIYNNKNKINTFKNNSIKKKDLNISKVYNKNTSNIKGGKKVNQLNKKLSYKNSKNINSYIKQKIKPKIKISSFSINNIKSKKNKKNSNNLSLNIDYKSNKYNYNSTENNIHNNKTNNLIHKNLSEKNIFINGYKNKKNIQNNKNLVNNSKNIIETIKKKVKKGMIDNTIQKDVKSTGKIKK